MLNKRLLVKNLLAHSSENSFYDKKQQLNLSSKEGKAKFLKHVCALANSNPNNTSFIVVGVTDQYNEVIGTDFFDDSKIQNLINAYLNNPPRIIYENVQFPHLPNQKVVGLVSIYPKEESSICSLRKNIWKYKKNQAFARQGSNSKPIPKEFNTDKHSNQIAVKTIEDNSHNTIKYTLDNVFEFMEKAKDFNPQYHVFKEYFVVCWAGQKINRDKQEFLSRVNIELINEQVKLFYSTFDEVKISYDDEKFEIVEYVHLGLKTKFNHYPLEKVSISFNNTMSYDIQTEMLFDPPQYDAKTLRHYLNHNNTLLYKIENNLKLSSSDINDLEQLPSIYLIAYLNGFENALNQLYLAKNLLKTDYDLAYQGVKDKLRILRKIKYN
ncbi:MAG: ATP-binding protein [Lactococcus lactis]|nr:ATP-binding protein [Lactococcus lactis]